MYAPSKVRLAFFIASFAILSACTNNGCQGPQGDLGPSGAQGIQGVPAAATYYYNSNFDSGANLSDWTVFKSGGAGTIQAYLDTTAFNSPTQSMAVSTTTSVNGDSFVYRSINFDLTKDIWIEFDWNLNGMNAEYEFVLNSGSAIKASIGFDATDVFITNSGTRYKPAPAISTTLWHHVKIKLDPTTGLSSYWLNGLSLGSGYATSLTPVGVPPTGNFVGHRLNFGGGTMVRIDNLVVYKY